MKRYFLFATALLATGTLFAQEKKIPTAAKEAFTKEFPGSSKVKWEQEKTDYEVHFTQGGKEMSAVYDASGKLVETEVEIPITALPNGAVSYVKEHYKTPVKEASKITKGNTVTYEAEVGKMDVIFDTKGKFIEEKKD